MNLLLTGANGFVGQYVQAALSGVPLPKGLDLRDHAALTAVVAAIRPDAVLHLAAQSFVPAAFENPHETFDINFMGTLNLLEALQSSGFMGRMLFVGSGDTYGQVSEADLPVREDHPLRPRNPYAVSKVAAEALCYQWSQTSDFEIVMARPFNHIGPGQSPRFAISDFARQVMEIYLGRRPPLLQVGDVDVTRDFTDVRDVVRAYSLLLERGRNGEIYNVCSGREYRIRDLLHQLMTIAGVEAKIEQDASRLRRAEQRRMVARYDVLLRDTNWQPEIPMEQSLQDLLNDWKEKLQ